MPTHLIAARIAFPEPLFIARQMPARFHRFESRLFHELVRTLAFRVCAVTVVHARPRRGDDCTCEEAVSARHFLQLFQETECFFCIFFRNRIFGSGIPEAFHCQIVAREFAVIVVIFGFPGRRVAGHA
ncbi:hypothetical protein D3C86_1732060 [compost metagenome]